MNAGEGHPRRRSRSGGIHPPDGTSPIPLGAIAGGLSVQFVFEPGAAGLLGAGRPGSPDRAAGSLAEGWLGLAGLPEMLAPGVGVRSSGLPVGLPLLPGGALGIPVARLTAALGSEPGGRGVSLPPCAKATAGAARRAAAMARTGT